jgi:hypothetical protein
MESGVMEDDSFIGQSMRLNMALKQNLVMVNGFQVFEYL